MWKKTGKASNINDIVFLEEDNTPPLQWSLARIMEIYDVNVGVARVAK